MKLSISKVKILIAFLFYLQSGISQRSNYWYFGLYAGLNFNTNPPTALTNGQINIPDNSSTISDANGNLLFYTNGINVWTSTHSVMVNGTGLIGNSSAGQCALIIPIPCDLNKYVIFHVTEFSNPGYLNYSVVDMSLNGGFGGVVASQKNVSLGSGWTEKLCAYYDPIGNKYWLLTHKWNSNQFVAFEINSTSIATNSVVSAIGSIHNCGTYGGAHDAMGQLTISQDGTKLINAITCSDKYELFDFNSSTGVVSNSISINGSGGKAWGTAFSPDSKKVYVNSIFGTTILQYDINTFSQTSILASQYTVVSVGSSGYNFGYMELGKDNKIYIAKPSSGTISVINNPNGAGSACNFSLAGQSLGGKTSSHGISRIAYNIPPGIAGFSISSSPNATIGCTNSNLVLSASASLSPGNYTWTGPGIIGSVNNQSVLVNSPGTYSCSIPVCSSSVTTMTISVFSNTTIPSIITNPSTINLCAGDSPTLNAIGALSATWQPGGLIGLTVMPTTPSVSTIYTVTGTSSLGCLTSNTLALNLNPIISISVTPSSPTICSGNNLTLTPTGALNYTLFSAAIGSSVSTIFIVSPSVTTTYTLIGSDANNCSSSFTNTITVYPTPNLTISPATNTICYGASLNLIASGAVTYSWYPFSNVGATLSLASLNSSTNFTLIGASSQSCTSIVSKSITVIPVPTVTALSNPSITCAGGTINLYSSGASNYTWIPGGSNSASISVSPLSTTIYTVLGESNGCTSSASIIVANPLSPTISSSGNLNCNNTSSFLYIASNSPTYSILWTGPGLSGQITSSVITVSNVGTYSCVLTDTITGCSATETIAITSNIGPLPVSIVPSNTTACFPGPSVNLLISASANYSWFPASEVNPPTGPLVTVNPSVTSTYSVLASLGVCSGSAVITISVTPTPTLVFPLNTYTICNGKIATLSVDGATDYLWQPGNSQGSTAVVSPVVTTEYTVTGTTQNCNHSTVFTVNVLPAPVLFASVYPSTICIGNTANLMASGAETILWSSSNFTSGLATTSVNPFSSTIYTATGTNSFGCEASSTVALVVNSGPSLIPYVSNTLICSGETVTLGVSGSTSYTWLPGNQNGEIIIASPSVSTTYSVISSTQGCSSYTTITVELNNCVKALFGVTNAADKPVFYKGSYYLIHFTVTAVNSSGIELNNVELNSLLPSTFPSPASYTVIDGPKITSLASALIANESFNGHSDLSLTKAGASKLLAGKRDTITYSVLLDPKGTNGNFKNWVIGYAGLFSNVTLIDSSNSGFNWDPDLDGNPANNNLPTLIEIPIIDLFIPEGFSPNGDGLNDVFEIKGLNERQVDLIVYNRWGNKVYEMNNYLNDWNGTPNVSGVSFGNGKLPEGTYYFILNFKDGKTQTITGFVVVKY